jgi:hypothetical protein
MRAEAMETVARVEALLTGENADGLVRREWRTPAHEEPVPEFVPDDPMEVLRRESAERAERRAAAAAELRREEQEIREAYSNASTLAEVDARIAAAVGSQIDELTKAIAEEVVVAERLRHERNLDDQLARVRRELLGELATLRGEVMARLDGMKAKADALDRDIRSALVTGETLTARSDEMQRGFRRLLDDVTDVLEDARLIPRRTR